jgi:hypothetical protein
MNRLAAALLCIAAGNVLAEACPAEVRVSFPNFPIPPLVLGSDSIASPPGTLVSWTRSALKRSGCTPLIRLQRRPPNRQLAELEIGALDILPGFSFSTELPPSMVFPMRDGAINTALRVVTDQSSLYVRKDDAIVSWDGETLRGARLRVGTSTGGTMETALARKHGWELEAAPTPHADLRKLLAGRIDAVLESDSLIEPHLAGMAIRRLAPPVVVLHRYAPVRKGFQQQYPEFTERFWLELCKQSRKTYPTLPACK